MAEGKVQHRMKLPNGINLGDECRNGHQVMVWVECPDHGGRRWMQKSNNRGASGGAFLQLCRDCHLEKQKAIMGRYNSSPSYNPDTRTMTTVRMEQ